jgi:hypothetical protein
MQIDYWHQTNYQALQWVATQSPSDGSALVIGKGESLMLNALMLPQSLERRIHCITPEFLDMGFSLDSMNAIWPRVNAQLKPGEAPFLPTKKIYWIDFGDHLQGLVKSGQPSVGHPSLGDAKSWRLVQSFYRGSLPLVKVYEGGLEWTVYPPGK